MLKNGSGASNFKIAMLLKSYLAWVLNVYIDVQAFIQSNETNDISVAYKYCGKTVSLCPAMIANKIK